MKYWLNVTSLDNFHYAREVLKFKVQGFSNRFRKQVQRMEIGDRVVYYIMKMQRFAGCFLLRSFILLARKLDYLKLRIRECSRLIIPWLDSGLSIYTRRRPDLLSYLWGTCDEG